MTCNKKWILYNNRGQLAQWSSKALLKAQLAPNKGHGHSLVVCCWSDPPQLSESWRNHYTWEACLADWWNALVTQRLQPAPINRKGPVLPRNNARRTPHSQRFKPWANWAAKGHLTHYVHLTSHQPTTISSRISIIFCRENISTTSSMHRMLFKSPSNLKAWVFTL